MTHPIFHRISTTTAILQQRHEVLFRDGSAIGLHLVQQHGLVHAYLRCIVSQGLHAIMFDLRDLASELAAEIPRAHSRDLPGLVSITLRHKYTSARHMHAAVFGVSRLAVLLPEAAPAASAPPAPARAWPRRTGARAWA